jgi:hypothetical protein
MLIAALTAVAGSATMRGMDDRTTDRKRPERDRSRPETDRNVVSAAIAAERLGLSPDAIRARIRRGTLIGEKRDGQWFVVLTTDDARSDATEQPTGDRPETNRNATADHDARLADKDAEIAYLRQLLDAEIEARRRADLMNAALLDRLPRLPAGDAGQDAAVATNQSPGQAEAVTIGDDAARPETSLLGRLLQWLRGS